MKRKPALVGTKKSNDRAALGRLMSAVRADPRPDGSRLRPIDDRLILALDTAGYGQVDIARIIRCSQKSVSLSLAQWDDTRMHARRHLEASALTLAERMVAEADPQTALKVLGKLDVVKDDKQTETGGGVQIIIGIPGAQHASLAPPVIDIKPVGTTT